VTGTFLPSLKLNPDQQKLSKREITLLSKLKVLKGGNMYNCGTTIRKQLAADLDGIDKWGTFTHMHN
jgi:hypothetical protein